MKRLGYSNGTDEVFSLSESSKKVWKWIEDGGEEEDAGNVFTASYYNHFHNPRFAWSEAGLNTLYPYINGISSVLWAQDDAANPWSWQRARDYYRLALSSSTKAERDANFANAFKGVGHMVHLIQDAAQPAHVRNDPHPLDDNGVVPGFEYWAKNPLNSAYVSNLMQSPAFPSLDLNTSVGGYVPITQFIDTNQGGGISEYTNANFFSEDTIFTEPSPSFAETIEYEETINGETRIYLKSTSVNHLAAARWFYLYLPDGYKGYGLKLDDAVYSDYAALLIPRAVGYSAGLINYFFRGQIDMKPDAENAGKYVIENLSSETMDGTFSLYYDDANGNRKLVQGADLSAANNVSIAPGASSASIPPFTEPTDAKEKGKYMLVFQGTLGAEEGAVAGKVVTLEEKKELILYAVNGVYKTFDPETKEVKPYSGILQGATGRVVWRADGDAAWAAYDKSWNIVDTEKNTVKPTAFSYYYYGDYYYGAEVGWKGEIPTAMFHKYVSCNPYNYYYSCYNFYYSEFLPDGTTTNFVFNVPSGLRPIQISVSWNGDEAAISSYTQSYYGSGPRANYILRFDTIAKNLTSEKIGDWSGYSTTNYPLKIAYAGNALNVLYYNHTYRWVIDYESFCYDDRSWTTSYDKLGTIDGYQRFCKEYQEAWSPRISPIDYSIMEDGTEIISYLTRTHWSNGWSSKVEATPYLYIGGNKYADTTAVYDSWGLYTRYESLVNLNGSKDKAIAMLRTRSYAYKQDGTEYDIAKTAMVYYISDGSISNIINDNPDFKDATFFTFIKK